MTCDALIKGLAAACVMLLGCGKDGLAAGDETGEGGDPGDGDGDPGDGDGDPGDGDGDPGDGDGDGDPGDGDGDGDPGDGDGDPDSCAAMDAVTGLLPCGLLLGWAWDGASCVEVLCSCEGDDCEALFDSKDECQLGYLECLEEAACAELGEPACLANDSCATLWASPVAHANGGQCLAEPSFVGCDDDQGCDDALTWGCDWLDEPYLFPSSCMPEGFTPCRSPGELPSCP